MNETRPCSPSSATYPFEWNLSQKRHIPSYTSMRTLLKKWLRSDNNNYHNSTESSLWKLCTRSQIDERWARSVQEWQRTYNIAEYALT